MIPASPLNRPRKSRCDTYLNSLSADDRQKVHALLLNPAVKLVDAVLQIPPWGPGRRAGKRLSLTSLCNIRHKLRLESLVIEAESNVRLKTDFDKLSNLTSLAPRDPELAIDLALSMIAEEVIAKTLHQLDTKDRNVSMRLLLKRADQRRWDRKMQFLEDQAKAPAAAPQPPPLTEDEKCAKIKAVFGM
jgi:hypothetical protein